jgi:hypothetical protein
MVDDVAALGGKAADVLSGDVDVALTLRLKTGEDAQQCRLSAAGWTEQTDELSVANDKRNVL